jgi:hypothetical protein
MSRPRLPAPPVATLGELRRVSCWLTLYCSNAMECTHRAPAALAPFVIRWGAEASSDRLRKRAKCSVCGTKGAALMLPSWSNSVGSSRRSRAKVLAGRIEFDGRRMTERKRKPADSLAYPPRLMRADRAAAYLSLSTSLFLRLVDEGKLPKSKRLGGVVFGIV